MSVLHGALVTLRPADSGDVATFVAMRSTPEVHHRWGGDDLLGEVREDLSEAGLHVYAIEYDGDVVGAIQWSAEDDPQYRHANIDIYLHPDVHGRGICTDSVRTLARHLIADHGHHRLSIDPAADNDAAIACYTKVGFRPVGIMRQYERGPDGTWHDGLLMDLLADDVTKG